MQNLRLHLLSLILCLCTCTSVMALPRTKAQMMSAATKAINAQLTKNHRAPKKGAVEVLKETGQLSVIGYQDGGFAVVSADDVMPEVLGVSSSHYSDGRNRNFNWWLNAMQQTIDVAIQNQLALAPIPPDETLYPIEVEPMLSTFWDQDTPYNDLCPDFNSRTKCLTGCVATALAQVLNYHQQPAHGIGQRTIKYKDQEVTADFENTYYDWDNMLDEYHYGQYDELQALAVATLMRDCGVAVNMEYGGPDEGSGAYSDDAADGIRQYFGITDATFYDRQKYSAEEWMNMVFHELSENGPLYYGGGDMWLGGHAFVLHGYRADGMVYVNWGWSGDDDGYYDISLLNPPGYTFSYGQDMIGGITSVRKELIADTLNVSQAGQLAQLLPDSLIGEVGTLQICGPINGSDLMRLRELAGRDLYDNKTKGCLKTLDLSKAQIVEGGTYMIENGVSLSTTADALPRKAFYGSKWLQQLILPEGLKSFGDGAIALCPRLTEVSLIPAVDADFYFDGQVIYTHDTTEVIAVLPIASEGLEFKKGITRLHDFALAGCARLSQLLLPESVNFIGKEAFNGCVSLASLKIASKEVPELGGANVFTGMQNSRNSIYVRSGMKNKYLSAAQWRDFTTEFIREFGTSVKVRNAVRYYGDENPELYYTMSGDKVEGTPILTCEATPLSPVGKYPIYISKGTIEDDVVDFYDGYLIVQKAPLTVGAVDTQRHYDEENPVFELYFEGFKNDEDASVFTTLPVATTTAVLGSPAGEYPITVSGGEAPNYKLSYVEGVLTVDELSGISEMPSAPRQDVIYHINGTRVDAQKMRKGIYIVNGKKVVK